MTATGRTADGSHSVAYSLNVGNLRDTGHSAEATPPAAMADDLPPCQLSRRQLAKVHRPSGTHGFGSLSDRNWPAAAVLDWTPIQSV
jgi:hypothetical protein